MPIDQFPDEVIQHLLYYVSPTDNLASIQLLCYRFNRLGNEQLLWRHHCRATFRYWSPEHDYLRKSSLRASEVDWKALFVLRQRRNARASRLLDEILATKQRRVKHMQQLCLLGYDIKDFLLEQRQTSETAEDVLSRRYFSEAILNSIHRAIAVKEWHSLRPEGNQASRSQVSGTELERALAAFDMFVLYDQPGDIDDVTQMIDESTSVFRSSQPHLDELTPRQKAVALNRWLRENKRFGGLDALNYRMLRNCLIGQIMRRDGVGSLPVIASAIFCCVAHRLGLEAHCCSVPGHVHVVVMAQAGHTLDGAVVENGAQSRDKMYLDPYGSDDEVTVANIEQRLAPLELETSIDGVLTPVPPASVALRTAQNIKASFQRTTTLPQEAWFFMVQLARGHPVVNIFAAYYSSMWASLLLVPAYSADWDLELSLLMKRFAASWPEDAWLIEKYLIPLWDTFAPFRGPWARHAIPETAEFWKPLRLLREQDELVPPVIRRHTNGADVIPYKIGQVFRHKRHNRIGIIRGWSHGGSSRFPSFHSTDDADHSDDNSGGEALSPTRPRLRVYFVCLVQYALDPYVIAADNMEIIHDPNLIKEDMFPWAGKYFKRFDQATCTFVSNMTEEYPDD